MGDGDGVTIGGNHFIHTARRNMDITAIITNNFNYGMTGGQYSASSPEGSRSNTSPFGTVEDGFDICDLSIASGATFVARTTPYHIRQMDQIVTQAIAHKGFSVVEIYSVCPTYYSRYNYNYTTVEMLEHFKHTAVNKKTYDTLTDEDKKDRFPIGILHHEEKEDFHTKYRRMLDQCRQDRS